MKFLKKKTKFTLSALVVCLTLCFFFGSIAYAGQFYPGGYQRCLDSSGGRSSFNSVQYACREAAEPGHGAGQNACASWLGPVNDNATRQIHIKIPKGATTASLSVYGMCTDSPNTTSDLYTMFDGGSITIGKNFRREAPWGTVSSGPVSLDVPKFKQIADTYTIGKTKVYWQIVGLLRGHSIIPGQVTSYDYELAWIYLYEGEIEPEDPELCKNWGPSTTSSATDGTSEVIIKVKNTEPRLAATHNGQWQEDVVYAKPTDLVNWHTCYYPGVQATAFTSVSSVNKKLTDGTDYPELPSDTCLEEPNVKINFKQIAPFSRDLGNTWENHFETSGAAGSFKSEEFGDGVWQWDKRMQKRDLYGVNLLDVDARADGKVQNAYTSIPKTSEVGDHEPSSVPVHENDCYCCGAASGSEVPDTCDEKASNAYIAANPTYVDTKDCKHLLCTNQYVDSGGNAVTAKNADVSFEKNEDHAKVIVPYNYILTAKVKLSGTVYSGETVTVSSAAVNVEQRYNKETLATYATKVPEAKAKLFAYVTKSKDGGGNITSSSSNGCGALKNVSKQCLQMENLGDVGPLNEGGSLEGDSKEVLGGAKTYNAFDASAGDYICYVLAVWPAESNGDTDTSKGGGNGEWRYSNPACKLIYKKPTFQVWGGSMYSNKGISTTQPQKYNIYGMPTDKAYTASGSNKTVQNFKKTGGTQKYYTPWVEESLVLAKGVTKTVDSGAGSSDENGRGENICTNGAWLTFANSPCNSTNSPGKSNIGSGISKSGDKDNLDELFDYWLGTKKADRNNGNDQKGKTITLKKSKEEQFSTDLKNTPSANVRYVYSSGKLTIDGGKVKAGKTFLVYAAGNLTITGDILYDPGAGYDSIEKVPKVVIYTAKDVNIGCDVKEVDAIIIAGGNVSTCSDSDDVNSEKNSNQLKIFGMVISNTIELGRTYGAAASKNPTGVAANKNSGAKPKNSSGVAAEIFDYDSTMLMWEEFMSGSGETDTYETTYAHELAPRY